MMYMKGPIPVESVSAFIDEKIKELGDWRGKMLAKVRDIIHDADPASRRPPSSLTLPKEAFSNTWKFLGRRELHAHFA